MISSSSASLVAVRMSVVPSKGPPWKIAVYSSPSWMVMSLMHPFYQAAAVD
ncbi:Uncharacterised protein [Mycobacteroides abscessus subsp. abscessus]|uniref:hypothetical protein n=1 Tax=Mycobacteroides abscessus TaxID=36809 RepID=UPI000925F1DD|nr:hypothetical protein [Mycobacteroides abscessus]SIH60950.1 Uncharacterised protein [Mycobacteroides abscessus subsp. abscessus]